MKRSKINIAMDYLDDDLIASAAQEKTSAPSNRLQSPRYSRKFWTRFAAATAAGVLLISGGIATAISIGNNQPIAVIAFDVNPSLEIQVNNKEKVVKVNPLNEDAKIVLEQMDFEGVGLDITVNALIGSMLKHGYLSVDKNSILISVNAKDNGKATTLRKNLSDDVTSLLLGSSIQASVITQTFDGKSENKDVSAAKSNLIRKIVAAGLTRADGSKYTYEQLSALRVHELQLLMDSKGLTVDGIEYSGKASAGSYLGEEKALQIACEHAKVPLLPLSKAEIELDFDDDVNSMIYEVEFTYDDFEYEYELNAVTGTILEWEKERDD